jgi:hypothetical protein
MSTTCELYYTLWEAALKVAETALTTIVSPSYEPPGRDSTTLPKRCDVTPEVLLRKLSYLRQLLADLAPYENVTLERGAADHYKLERIFELLVVATTDVIVHLYERVDYAILHDGIRPALHDFSQVVALFEGQIGDES